MNLRNLMTPNPACCLPSDSVAVAAQIMKQQDVGPVPVVDSHENRMLVGIVTDRDLAVRIVAEGRDPHNTRVDQVMSANPVTCNPEDNVSAAVRVMADNQIRRLPVVDASGHLVGIVAQADVARAADEEQVGEMVEEISQPFGAGEWTSSRPELQEAPRMRSARVGAASALATGAVCLGIGAGLMYLLDPSGGRRRRAVIRDKTTSALSSSSSAVRRTTEDLRNRATGAYAATRSRFSSEQVPDEKLVERVRSRMGRHVSNPHAVQVQAHEGNVTVSGPVLAEEAEALITCVRGIPGIRSVENLLEVHTAEEKHPSLQGRQRASQTSAARRLLSGAVGGGLMLYGLKSKSKLAKTGASVGLGMLSRGLGWKRA